MSPAKSIVVLVNELTLLRLIYFLVLGRDVRLLGVAPLFPPLRPLFDSIAARLVRTGRTAWVVEEFPDLKPIWNYVTLVYAKDPFRKLEGWQAEYFDYAKVDRCDPKYAMCFKHASGRHYHWKYVTMFFLHAIATKRPAWQVFGVTEDVLHLCQAYFGSAPFLKIQPLSVPSRLINAVITMLLAFYGVVWAMTRLRWRVEKNPFFLAVDFYNDVRDRYLYEELSDGGDILLVMRNAETARLRIPGFERYPACLPGDGLLGPSAFLTIISEVADDFLKIYRLHGRRNPELYFQCAMWPVRRLYLRALFERFRPRFFWGRDDYLEEHILRHQELHRIGARSFGGAYYVPGIATMLPVCRYLSFDVYYMMAAVIHTYYKNTWPADMTIRFSGPFGFSRNELSNKRPAGRDIVVMTRFAVGNAEIVKIVRQLAARFPDRKIVVQIKNEYFHGNVIPDFLFECTNGFQNVDYTRENVYKLVLKAACIVTDASTIISEALQVRTPVVMADVIPGHETCIFREFPDLCFCTAEQVVNRVAGILSGRTPFQFEKYSGLFNASPTNFYDMVREDMGLEHRNVLNGVAREQGA